MKERPILFSAPMVRALLAGTKTQTRRVVKPAPQMITENTITTWDGPPTALQYQLERMGKGCPYGQPGDRLWVRESLFLSKETDRHHYSATGLIGSAVDYEAEPPPSVGLPARSIPSIHMPRWASRITLEITSVRVERLQDISFADAAAEGLHYTSERLDRWSADGSSWVATPQNAYRALWQDINGPDSWAANPWVWVVEFRRLKP
jgi:hypothetical protein